MRPMLVGVLLVGVLVIGGVSGQAQRNPASTDDLLVELRGLRAEVNQAANANIRAQLLVGRLQLQEQRIDTVARQLGAVQDQLSIAIRETEAVATELKGNESAIGRVSPEKREEVEGEIRYLTTNLQQRQRREQQLRVQESELSGQLAAEQNRWMDFNSRLDELERQLPGR
jgi:hypothetical protein